MLSVCLVSKFDKIAKFVKLMLYFVMQHMLKLVHKEVIT